MVAHRGHNEGSIYWVESKNRYVASVVVGIGPKGTPVRRTALARTQAEARAKLRDLKKDAELGVGAPGDLSVGRYLEQWIEDVLPSLRKSSNTAYNYTWALRLHIIPQIGTRKLRDLVPEDVEAALQKAVRDGLGLSSVGRVQSVLGMALRHAERRGLVGRNAAKLAVIPHAALSRKEIRHRRSLTHEEARALVIAVRGHRLEAMWMCGMTLGPRPGELAGLLWSGVDLDEAVLRITGSRIYEDGEMRLGKTKTKKAVRSLELPDFLVVSFRRHAGLQEAERAAAGERWVGSGLVFSTRTGTMLDPSNLRSTLDRLAKKAGIEHFVPYEMRHTATSLLSDAGMSIEEIADLLGHTTTRMVEQVYRHRIRKVISVGTSPMEGIIDSVRGEVGGVRGEEPVAATGGMATSTPKR